MMIMAEVIITKLVEKWHDQKITISLPPPSNVQKIALLEMALAVLGLSIQGLLGGYLMHKYVDPESLYGITGLFRPS